MDGRCRFPEFLQTPLKDGSMRTWLTMTEYSHNTNKWVSQKRVTVRGGDITTVVKLSVPCPEGQDKCPQSRPIERRVCYRAITANKYLVEHYENAGKG